MVLRCAVELAVAVASLGSPSVVSVASPLPPGPIHPPPPPPPPGPRRPISPPAPPSPERPAKPTSPLPLTPTCGPRPLDPSSSSNWRALPAAHGGHRARHPSLTPTGPGCRHHYPFQTSPRGGVSASPRPRPLPWPPPSRWESATANRARATPRSAAYKYLAHLETQRHYPASTTPHRPSCPGEIPAQHLAAHSHPPPPPSPISPLRTAIFQIGVSITLAPSPRTSYTALARILPGGNPGGVPRHCLAHAPRRHSSPGRHYASLALAMMSWGSPR